MRKLKEATAGLGFGFAGLMGAAAARDMLPPGQGMLLGGVLLAACIIGGFVCMDWIRSKGE